MTPFCSPSPMQKCVRLLLTESQIICCNLYAIKIIEKKFLKGSQTVKLHWLKSLWEHLQHKQAQKLTPIPSTGFMYNPHMGRLKNLTCFEVFCLISIGAFSSNTALRNCFGTLFSEIPLRQELLFRNSADEGVNIWAWLESVKYMISKCREVVTFI